MGDFRTISQDLSKMLDLKYEAVGVTLYREGEPLPKDLAFTQENLKSYCQAVVLAGQGLLEKYGVGLFATEEASAATIHHSFYLEAGKTRAALIAPLSFFQVAPQVVVFTADSEQVMWLLYALNYARGGRMNLPQSGGALGGCADLTSLPLLEKVPNITFLGLGCRLKTGLDPCHLMLGAPGESLAGLHEHLSAMAKPIGMLKKR
ncbi:MAG: DUF169 domain-containing protein [Deltaproteobacteria bacterium]|nr:DUF169 domain-containing protein [Deltaproteobacteria bacterium]